MVLSAAASSRCAPACSCNSSSCFFVGSLEPSFFMFSPAALSGNLTSRFLVCACQTSVAAIHFFASFLVNPMSSNSTKMKADNFKLKAKFFILAIVFHV
jgi:hypothetical protein